MLFGLFTHTCAVLLSPIKRPITGLEIYIKFHFGHQIAPYQHFIGLKFVDDRKFLIAAGAALKGDLALQRRLGAKTVCQRPNLTINTSSVR
jgi:hypothetical protein